MRVERIFQIGVTIVLVLIALIVPALMYVLNIALSLSQFGFVWWFMAVLEVVIIIGVTFLLSAVWSKGFCFPEASQ